MRNDIFKTGFASETSGLTMVELIISLAVFSMLLLVITPIYKQGSGFWQATRSQVELRQNINAAVDTIAREIRQANTVDPGLAVNPGENIVTVNGTNSFVLAGTTGSRYIEFKSEPVTSKTMIDITKAEVRQLSAGSKGYEISIWGRYQGNAAVHESYKEMKVSTMVFSRTGSNITVWKENN